MMSQLDDVNIQSSIGMSTNVGVLQVTLKRLGARPRGLGVEDPQHGPVMEPLWMKVPQHGPGAEPL